MYLVSKTSKACAAPCKNRYDYRDGPPFSVIELTKNHTFNNNELVWDTRFLANDYSAILNILYPKSGMAYGYLEAEARKEKIFRDEVIVFIRDMWYLCVRKDEVLEK